MGVMAHSPPNYQIALLGSAGSITNITSVTPVDGVYPPVMHYNGLPDPNSIIGGVNGLMQGVYAYAGAQLFVEFMAELKRPRDFLKAMWGVSSSKLLPVLCHNKRMLLRGIRLNFSSIAAI